MDEHIRDLVEAVKSAEKDYAEKYVKWGFFTAWKNDQTSEESRAMERIEYAAKRHLRTLRFELLKALGTRPNEMIEGVDKELLRSIDTPFGVWLKEPK